jgi:molecular chaperone IbpA
MRTFDFTPYYRSTVGFDRLFDLMEKTVASDWPPYDIEKTGEDAYRITLAVAGFAANEVDVVQQGATLTVSGQKAEQKGVEILHKGIPSVAFRQSFNLADHVKVAGATLLNGLLVIDLVREVPEQLKPRRIEIAAGAAVKQDGQPKRIDKAA